MEETRLGAKIDEKSDGADPGRRNFIRGAAVAGALGAMGLNPAMGKAAAPQAVMTEVVDPATPDGMKRPSMLGSKYPVTYEKSVPAAMAVMTNYFAALARRDLRGMSESLIYPHGTYEGTDATIVQSAQELMDNPPLSMNVTGKGDSLIQRGAYDVLETINLHVFNPIRVGLSLTYSRFQPSGHKILQCDGLYYVTNNDGKWGIELASTIFTPADQIGVTYNDAREAFIRMERDSWMAVYMHDPQEAVYAYNQFGKQATIPWGGSGVDLYNAREGNPMERYRVKGVKNRMTVSDVPLGNRNPRSEPANNPANSPANADANRYGGPTFGPPNEKFPFSPAGEAVGKYAYTLVVPWARVLHATLDKAHVFSGLLRYTPDWKRITELRYLEYYTYKRGRWGRNSGGDPDHFQEHSDDAVI